jgi:type IV secretory pathway TrbF-like protein|tara:strand:- start:33928 stop:34716 length:789 start_codon:yes stop_codon:yes gene_type:complete
MQILKNTLQFFRRLKTYFFSEKDDYVDRKLKVEQTKIMQEALKNPDNPYLYGYATYVALYADQEDKSTYYKNINRVLLILVIVFGVLLCAVTTSSKVQPYVIGINQNGQVFDMNQKVTNLSDGQLRAKLAKSYIGDYIKYAFSVSVDGNVQRGYQSTAYAMSKGFALNRLHQYYATHNPFKLAGHEVVSTDITYILPLSADTIRVSWKQVARNPKTAKIISSVQYMGEFTYHWDVHATAKLVQKFNPLGFYIDSMTWSKEVN